jgi:hypothetical protein
MKRVIGAVLLAVVLCVVVILVYFASGRTLEMRIARQEIESSVQKIFPVNRGIVRFDLINGSIECLSGENRMVIGGDIKIAVLGMINAEGNCRVSGQPQYNPAIHTIQFKDLRVEKLELNGMPEKLQDQVVQLAGRAILAFLAEYPFYQFDRRNWWQKFIGRHVRQVEIGADGLVLTLGW